MRLSNIGEEILRNSENGRVSCCSRPATSSLGAQSVFLASSDAPSCAVCSLHRSGVGMQLLDVLYAGLHAATRACSRACSRLRGGIWPLRGSVRTRRGEGAPRLR